MNKKIGFSMLFLLFMGLVFYIYNSYYTLQPGQSVKIHVGIANEALDPRTELYLVKKDTSELLLTGQKIWTLRDSDLWYDVGEQRISRSKVNEDREIVKEYVDNRSSNDLYISEKGLIARYKGENVFYATSSEPFDFTLTNVGNELVTFTTHVVYR
ncbi:hypothetical protein [Streptococcus oralis]|nr:hypothetical protein [Streptococcus oralis]